MAEYEEFKHRDPLFCTPILNKNCILITKISVVAPFSFHRNALICQCRAILWPSGLFWWDFPDIWRQIIGKWTHMQKMTKQPKLKAQMVFSFPVKFYFLWISYIDLEQLFYILHACIAWKLKVLTSTYPMIDMDISYWYSSLTVVNSSAVTSFWNYSLFSPAFYGNVPNSWKLTIPA